MSASFGLHRYTTLLGLGFALMHALSLLGDPYMGYTLGQILTPFMAGSYKTQWLGLGQVALYSLAVVSFSFYARNRLGVRTWRLIHSLSFALFLIALIHGLQSGSDSGYWWASALYWVSAVSVLVGSIYRVTAVRTGRSREKAVATGLVAVGGRAQARPAPRVLTIQPSPERVLVQR
jgi:predicted ferric reductase